MGWNYSCIPKLHRFHRLEMINRFHPTLYTGCHYLSMYGLKLIHVSERAPDVVAPIHGNNDYYKIRRSGMKEELLVTFKVSIGWLTVQGTDVDYKQGNNKSMRQILRWQVLRQKKIIQDQIFILRKIQPFSILTHWGRDEMNNISQTTFSNVFSSMKMFEFRLKFHWSLFPRSN